MKNIVNGVIAGALVGWLGYTLAAPLPCDRISRAAAPARGAMTLVRDISRNWVSNETRLDLIGASIWVDEQVQGVIGTTFYNSPKCDAKTK